MLSLYVTYKAPKLKNMFYTLNVHVASIMNSKYSI